MIPPLFSIITVCYNAESTIGSTLDSVDEQTCELYEHIIIDGASCDSTCKIVEAHGNHRRVLFSEPDTGLYDAMNKGLDHARGEYVIFLNAGDTFHSSETLQVLADTAMANDFPGIMYGQTVLVDKERNKVGDRHLTAPSELSYNSFAQGMVVCHQAFVPLRRITSRYTLKYRYSADYEWCIRCLQHSRRNCYIDAVLIDYLNEGLTTANHFKSLRERFSIMSYYYGLFPTVMRHFKFFMRDFKRRHKK